MSSFFLGKTYFFKGKGFWKFDDSVMHVAHNEPQLSAPRWMNCPRPRHIDVEEIPTQKAPLRSSTTRLTQSYINFVFTITVICLVNLF